MLMPVLVRFDERTILGLEEDVDAGDHWRVEEGPSDLAEGLVRHLPAAPRPRDGRRAAPRRSRKVGGAPTTAR